MITVPELAAEALGSFLSSHLERRFGSTDAALTELISWVSRLSLECIGNSDALYHTVEHTMLVTLVGYDIMKGRSLLMPTSAADYAHVLVACLMHDIGYVRGLLTGDGADGYVIDARGGKAKLPRGASDAALTAYHVDRSKLFVLDRLAHMDYIDAPRVARAIEFTRFPSAIDPEAQLGYASPADLTDLYPQFYYNTVAPHIQTAIRYLNVTSSGRQWISSLYSNVFRAESELSLSGPER
jgi:hypothetical protein